MKFEFYNEEWLERWRERRTGWDLGGAHPKLMDVVQMLQNCCDTNLIGNLKVAVPGCGSGHDAFFISQKMEGSKVEAFDISNEAICIAKSSYARKTSNNLDFFMRDIFEEEDEKTERSQYDFIYDRAMLCALRPEQREDYVAWLFRHTRTKGFVGALIFDCVESLVSHRPPFEITKPMLYMLFPAKEWDVIYNESYPSIMENTVIKSERLYLLQKK